MRGSPSNRFGIILSFTLFVAACVAPSGDEETKGPASEQAGSLISPLYAVPGTYWSRAADGIAHIPVCWVTSGSATEKSWVRNTVESQWASIPTVRFEGWGDCGPATPTVAVRIVIEDTTANPRSDIGPTTSNPSMYLNFTFKNWGAICADAVDSWPGIDDREYCVRGIALHEFGHVLGFGHEQNRLANGNDCGSAQGAIPGLLLSEYDPQSTMNYCATWGKQVLTPDDRRGAALAYGAQAFAFSYSGPLTAYSNCVSVNEPADPHAWSDNYLCTNISTDLRWSAAGPIGGMRCTAISEPSDPQTWNDNYVCVPSNSPIHLSWSYGGPIAGLQCTQWYEPSDPDTWTDNFLCWDMDYAFSSRGPLDGMECTSVDEPSDPYPWRDDYFCARPGSGLRWSYAGQIASMQCTPITEPGDPHTWTDNYLCAPPGSRGFHWSYAGTSFANQTCIPWTEPEDPEAWSDNALCYCSVAGQSLCGANCVSKSSDVANCGACGHACGFGHSCQNGACVAQTTCGSGQIPCWCTGACAPAAACGHICGP